MRRVLPHLLEVSDEGEMGPWSEEKTLLRRSGSSRHIPYSGYFSGGKIFVKIKI